MCTRFHVKHSFLETHRTQYLGSMHFIFICKVNLQNFTSTFIILLYAFVVDSSRDISDICIFQYSFWFGKHEKPFSTWTKMSLEQRERHMKRVMCANMHCTHMADSDEQDRSGFWWCKSKYSQLSVSSTNMSSESWKCIVAKAHAIAADSSSMSAVPGGNVQSRFVVLSRHPAQGD